VKINLISLQDFFITSEIVTFKYYESAKQKAFLISNLCGTDVVVSNVCGRDVVVRIIQKYGTNRFGEFI
jgi:hypothetical protein